MDGHHGEFEASVRISLFFWKLTIFESEGVMYAKPNEILEKQSKDIIDMHSQQLQSHLTH